jgi:hypothetical protein
MSPFLHLTTETDPVSVTLSILLFRILDDGQSQKPNHSEYLQVGCNDFLTILLATDDPWLRYHLIIFYLTHAVGTASLNSLWINPSLLCVCSGLTAAHLQLQVPWEVDNTVCSSDDVTIVDERSSAAVKQGARSGTCHKQDRRISDVCV